MYRIEKIIENAYKNWKDREYIYEKVDGEYESITFGQFIKSCIYFAQYLLDNGLKDKKIAIFSENSTNWMIADMAIMAYVGESVTISKEYKYEEMCDTLNLLDISCIIYSNTKQDIITRLKEKYKDITYICIQDDFESILNEGRQLAGKKSDIFDFEVKDIEKCSKIIFTSGTTSLPKAAMLSLKNVFSGIDSLSRRVNFTQEDVCYLFLPLSHTYGNIYNFVYSLYYGFRIYLSSSIDKIAQELLEVNPTIFCAVPLIYMKLYYAYGENIDKAFGKNIRFLFSGGAYFQEEIRKKYKEKGLNLMEAYALTETGSSLCIEYSYSDDTKSVGTVYEDIQVKIIDKDKNGNGEIVVKGDNVFLGYANDPEATARVLDNDGFFHTGDIGYLDDKNRLYLTGRKKKILIGANGENISVEKIEERIKKMSIENINKVRVYLNKKGILCCDIYVIKEDNEIDRLVEEYNKIVPKYERIKEYNVVIDSLDKRLKQ